MKNTLQSKNKAVRLGLTSLEDRVVLNNPAALTALSSLITAEQAAAPTDPTAVSKASAAVHAVTPGISLVGTDLYIVGNGNDFVGITPTGAKGDGSTGITVSSNLPGGKTFTGPITKIHVYLSGGQDTLQVTMAINIPLAVFTGGGNSFIHLDEATSYAWLGGAQNTVVGCDGNDTITSSGGNTSIQLGNGNDTVNITGDGNGVQLGSGTNNVTINGSHSNVQLGNSNANVIVNGGYTQVKGGNGNVRAIFSYGHDNVTLGNGQHDVENFCGCGGNFISLGDGPAYIALGGPNNTVQAGCGDVIATIAGGNNSVKFGNGNDNLSIAGNNNTIVLGNGNETVTAGTNTSLTAGNGSKTITIGGNGSTFLGNGNAKITYTNFTGTSPAGQGTTIYTTDGAAYLQVGAGSLTIV